MRLIGELIGCDLTHFKPLAFTDAILLLTRGLLLERHEESL